MSSEEPGAPVPVEDPLRPPDALRQGVREGVLAALGQSGAGAARRLLAAGAAGVLGSVGAVLLLAGHPYDHHPGWHLATFSCAWGALLVVAGSHWAGCSSARRPGLQCVDAPAGSFAGWLLGTLLGAGAGFSARAPDSRRGRRIRDWP